MLQDVAHALESPAGVSTAWGGFACTVLAIMWKFLRMMGDLGERFTRIETKFDGHAKEDDERFEAVGASVKEAAADLRALPETIRAAVNETRNAVTAPIITMSERVEGVEGRVRDLELDAVARQAREEP